MKDIKKKVSSSTKKPIYMDNTINIVSPSTIINYSTNLLERQKKITYGKEIMLNILNTNKDNYSIFFTCGIDESNNLILTSCVNSFKKIKKVIPHVVISSVESYSLLKYANSLKESGNIELTILKGNAYGCIMSTDIITHLKENTCLVMISYINPKTGSVNNVNKISQILHERNIPLHSDCLYLFGNHTLDLSSNNIDSVSLSFDRINAPSGIGILAVRNPLLDGYRLKDHSSLFESNTCNGNVELLQFSIKLLVDKLKDRKLKNKKLLSYRNQIIECLGKKCQILTFANFMKTDEAPLTEDTNHMNKLIILGPPIDNVAYYTPSILSFIIMTKKNIDNITIKKKLENHNIFICNTINNSYDDSFYNDIGIPSDAKKYIIRLSINDNITSDNIKFFIKIFMNVAF